MIRFVDPRAATATAVQPYDLCADWSVGPPAIGLLANGFPDSEAFLAEVGAVLAERVPGVALRSWNKGNASVPASDQLLDGIAAEVAAVIAAYGHWGSCTTGTVRDGVNLARRGIPAVALVTTEFQPQGDFVARSLGMPDLPRVILPHPVAGTGRAGLRAAAEGCVDRVLAALGRPS